MKTKSMFARFLSVALAVIVGLVLALVPAAQAIEMVLVGDTGNAAETTTGFGAVNYEYYIAKYEVSNAEYCEFLNAAAKSDVNSANADQATQPAMYSLAMGTDARGGITRTGTADNWVYTVRDNMGDKPVGFLQFYQVAYYLNWLNDPTKTGAQVETGVYTVNATSWDGKWKGSVTRPANHSFAEDTYWIPTENEWYKAAFYKGGGTSAGYWTYATQSDTAPTAVTAGSTGIGSAGSTGNYANYNNEADWNGQNGNFTTIGSNGGPSAYGTFDQSGNQGEFLETKVDATKTRFRGSFYASTATSIDSTQPAGEGSDYNYDADAGGKNGFRVAANFLPAGGPASTPGTLIYGK